MHEIFDHWSEAGHRIGNHTHYHANLNWVDEGKYIHDIERTAELIEPVPRSVLLASLTNNLPAGVSLLRLNVVQKESKLSTAKPAKKYQKARTEKAAAGSLEKLLETAFQRFKLDVEMQEEQTSKAVAEHAEAHEALLHVYWKYGSGVTMPVERNSC